MGEKLFPVLVLEGYEDFKCIGPDCEDSCCQGWQVRVDRNTLERYRTHSESSWFESRLTAEVPPAPEAAARMNLDSNRQCPFWDADRLCLIHKRYGEDFLPCICRRFPREVSMVDDGMREKALAFSCPEAARRVLGRADGLRLKLIEEPEDPFKHLFHRAISTRDGGISSFKQHFLKVRTLVIKVLQFRAVGVAERLIMLGTLCKRISRLVEGKLYSCIPHECEAFEREISLPETLSAIRGIPGSLEPQLEIIQALDAAVRQNHALHARYGECAQGCVRGLGASEPFERGAAAAALVRAVEQFYAPFLRTHEHMLENYLVSNVFRELFPFAEERSIFNQYAELALKFALVRLHILGLANQLGRLDPELVVRVVQSFSKTFEASRGFRERVAEVLKGRDFDSLPSIAALLKL